MTPVLLVVGAVLALLALLALGSLRSLICICSPNEVLIFSGGRRRAGKGVIGYRLVKGGRGVRLPLLERVDRMDLTNMVIELTAKKRAAFLLVEVEGVVAS